MALLFRNNAESTLASTASAVATTITVVDGSVFPSPGSDTFLVTLTQGSGPETSWEIALCTARSGNDLTVTRAQEGTAAAEWPAGTKVSMRLTAGALAALGTGAAANISLNNTVSGLIAENVQEGIDELAATKQNTLVSGTNIKTINGQPLLGEGDVTVSGLPTGAIAYVASSTAPTGFLKANGAEVSRTTYADLFAAIGTTFGAGNGSTTFNLPDLRGEFIRGWDNGRGVDAGRAFGSAQGEAFKSHSHTGSTDSAGAHAHTVKTPFPGSAGGTTASSLNASSPQNRTTSSAGAHTHTLSINATGGAETRPRNIALLACIKF